MAKNSRTRAETILEYIVFPRDKVFFSTWPWRRGYQARQWLAPQGPEFLSHHEAEHPTLMRTRNKQGDPHDSRRISMYQHATVGNGLSEAGHCFTSPEQLHAPCPKNSGRRSGFFARARICMETKLRSGRHRHGYRSTVHTTASDFQPGGSGRGRTVRSTITSIDSTSAKGNSSTRQATFSTQTSYSTASLCS